VPTKKPPRVFISYSHDSAEHEARVLSLATQLREDGIDVELDRFEEAPEEGWPAWMERQIREADFVLVVCTGIYLERIEDREQPDRGYGVIWEGRIIYNILYLQKLTADKFIPVLFEGASIQDIPLPLVGFTRYWPGIPAGYEALLRHLKRERRVPRPPLGHAKRLPSKGVSENSLPTVSSLEQLSRTMSNPRYADDIYRLDRVYDRRSVINNETIIVVVGTTVVAELLDRPSAELLRDEIDRRGGVYPYRRGIILTDRGWYDEAPAVAANSFIAIGGPPANKVAKELADWVPPQGSKEGKYEFPGLTSAVGFYRRSQSGLPQVGLWGKTANGTREAVERYLQRDDGLSAFLRMCWKDA
jgi:hypothetical protein